MNVAELKTKGPEKCQEICRNTPGCTWFIWKKLLKGCQGKCSRISRVRKMASNIQAKGIISGPAKCGGIEKD